MQFVDTQLVAGCSALKHFAVILFIKQGSEFTVCIDLDRVPMGKRRLSTRCSWREICSAATRAQVN